MNTAGYVPLLDLITAQPLWQHQVAPEEVKQAIRTNKTLKKAGTSFSPRLEQTRSGQCKATAGAW